MTRILSSRIYIYFISLRSNWEYMQIRQIQFRKVNMSCPWEQTNKRTRKKKKKNAKLCIFLNSTRRLFCFYLLFLFGLICSKSRIWPDCVDIFNIKQFNWAVFFQISGSWMFISQLGNQHQSRENEKSDEWSRIFMSNFKLAPSNYKIKNEKLLIFIFH